LLEDPGLLQLLQLEGQNRLLNDRSHSSLYHPAIWDKYYVSGHFPSSCLYLKTPSCLFFKIRFGDWILSPSLLRPTQLGPIDIASPYLRTPVPAPTRDIQAKHSINHLQELRKRLLIETPHIWGLAPETIMTEIITGETW
jgi:hypothetical protein